MATFTRGEHVYQCDVCRRKIRVPENKQGLDLLPNCNITLGCLGVLHRVFLTREINATPAFPPEVPGVLDWFARKVLYTHTQPVEATVWLIQHDLGGAPAVNVYINKIVDGGKVLTVAEPLRIETVDENTTRLYFASAYSGVAQCVSSASQNTTNPNAIAPTTATAETLQLSSDAGEVTIATLNSSPTVSVTLTYLTAASADDVIIDYVSVDNVVSVDSPWVGAQTAIINGKKYTLRSFNLRNTPTAPSYFDQGLVSSGAAFYVSAVNGVAPTANQCLFLLGTYPYASVDRVYDKIVDVASINQVSPQTYYDNGKGFVQPEIIKSTYPRILVVG